VALLLCDTTPESVASNKENDEDELSAVPAAATAPDGATALFFACGGRCGDGSAPRDTVALATALPSSRNGDEANCDGANCDETNCDEVNGDEVNCGWELIGEDSCTGWPIGDNGMRGAGAAAVNWYSGAALAIASTQSMRSMSRRTRSRAPIVAPGELAAHSHSSCDQVRGILFSLVTNAGRNNTGVALRIWRQAEMGYSRAPVRGGGGGSKFPQTPQNRKNFTFFSQQNQFWRYNRQLLPFSVKVRSIFAIVWQLLVSFDSILPICSKFVWKTCSQNINVGFYGIETFARARGTRFGDLTQNWPGATPEIITKTSSRYSAYSYLVGLAELLRGAIHVGKQVRQLEA